MDRIGDIKQQVFKINILWEIKDEDIYINMNCYVSRNLN